MNVRRVVPSGYCKGVVRAIRIALDARRDFPQEPVYVAGMIVHNRYVAEALEQKGIITLDDSRSKEEWINSLDHGVLIFSAHGIAQYYKDLARSRGLIVIDASCEDVIETQKIITRELMAGKEIFYIGKKGHPEAEAVLSLSEHIHLLDDPRVLPDVEGEIFVTNQTTMSIFEVAGFSEMIRMKYPDAEFQQEICQATSSRQQALLRLFDCDLLYVVGDPRSNNSNKLAEIAHKAGIPLVRMIEDVSGIQEEDLHDRKNVCVTAGASTPPYLSQQVLDTIKKYAESGILEIPEVEIDKIL
ncbi:MAG: 4-hydroxy-3-methylbut-2-enyl diphosphate reductase [Erysipelotrichaceae bacterium]|nr:4-hydroxy-3-methylbut-2-enyl diphosphate reductase [Erysipelotrichaceae bacterium]